MYTLTVEQKNDFLTSKEHIPEPFNDAERVDVERIQKAWPDSEGWITEVYRRSIAFLEVDHNPYIMARLQGRVVVLKEGHFFVDGSQTALFDVIEVKVPPEDTYTSIYPFLRPPYILRLPIAYHRFPQVYNETVLHMLREKAIYEIAGPVYGLEPQGLSFFYRGWPAFLRKKHLGDFCCESVFSSCFEKFESDEAFLCALFQIVIASCNLLIKRGIAHLDIKTENNLVADGNLGSATAYLCDLTGAFHVRRVEEGQTLLPPICLVTTLNSNTRESMVKIEEIMNSFRNNTAHELEDENVKKSTQCLALHLGVMIYEAIWSRSGEHKIFPCTLIMRGHQIQPAYLKGIPHKISLPSNMCTMKHVIEMAFAQFYSETPSLIPMLVSFSKILKQRGLWSQVEAHICSAGFHVDQVLPQEVREIESPQEASVGT